MAVIREKTAAVRDGDTNEDQAMAMLLTKLNAEIKYISEREDRARVSSVIEECFGKEGLALYRERKIARMFPDSEPF